MNAPEPKFSSESEEQTNQVIARLQIEVTVIAARHDVAHQVSPPAPASLKYQIERVEEQVYPLASVQSHPSNMIRFSGRVVSIAFERARSAYLHERVRVADALATFRFNATNAGFGVLA